jgi:predicted ABC-type exoprotein transport system permease subunit
MKEQQFSNHVRYVPGYHYVTSIAILALIIGSFVNLYHATPDTRYSASLICLLSIVLIPMYWYLRVFALRAQDRAIRAEENFRHFLLTGKPLPASLRMGQIVALRFASDAEFPALAQKAADEKMKGRDIKQAIQNWRPDFNRV